MEDRIAFGIDYDVAMMISERNPLNKQEEGVAYETPVTIEILSSAENTYLLHNDL